MIQRFNKYLFYFAAVPLSAITLLTVLDVTGRIFNKPIQGTFEIGTAFLAVSIVLILAHTQALKENTVVDIIFNKLPRRAKLIINLITTVLSLFIVILIALRATIWIGFSIRTGEEFDIIFWPVWIFKAFVILGFASLSLQLILDVINCFLALLSKKSDIGIEEVRVAEARTLFE